MKIFKWIKEHWELIVFYLGLGSTAVGSTLISEFQEIKVLQWASGILFIFLFVIGSYAYKLQKENKDLKSKLDEKIVEHDKAIFQKSDDILHQALIDDLINLSLYHHTVNINYFYKIEEYQEFFKNISNRFLHKNIKVKFDKWLKSINDLDFFFDEYFEATSDMSDCYKLDYHNRIKSPYREPNPELVKKLKELREKAYNDFIAYRQTIKHILLI